MDTRNCFAKFFFANFWSGCAPFLRVPAYPGVYAYGIRIRIRDMAYFSFWSNLVPTREWGAVIAHKLRYKIWRKFVWLNFLLQLYTKYKIKMSFKFSIHFEFIFYLFVHLERGQVGLPCNRGNYTNKYRRA